MELMKIEDPLEREFYEKECESEQWGVRELKRQMKSMLFQRIALSKDKEEVLKLAKEGQVIEKPEDILKEPYGASPLRRCAATHRWFGLRSTPVGAEPTSPGRRAPTRKRSKVLNQKFNDKSLYFRYNECLR